MKKSIIIIIVLAVVAVIALVWYYFKNTGVEKVTVIDPVTGQATVLETKPKTAAELANEANTGRG